MIDDEDIIVLDLPKHNHQIRMCPEEYIRWLCLIEAIDVSATEAERRGINTETDDSWISTIAFSKYIKERYESMKYDVMVSGESDEEFIFTGEVIYS